VPKSAKAKKTPSISSGARIGKYVVHPFRAMVPDAKEETYQRLLAGIREHGQRYPILTDAEGRVVDGRARLRACLELGLEPKFEREQRTDLAMFTLDTMMDRVWYSKAQAVVVAASLMEHLELEAAAKKRREHTGEVRENFPKGRAAQIAVDAVGIGNYKDVAKAAKMLKSDPDIIELIRAGKIDRMTDAYRIAALQGEHREKVLSEIHKGAVPAIALRDARSKDDLWLTPRHIAEAIRAAFEGTIVCDPCSPPDDVEQYVNADVRYTEEQDGLDRETNPWYDRTFVNPPFSEVRPWIRRAIEEAASGKRIYMLLPVHPDTDYQAAVLNAARDYFLIEGRVAFGKPGSKSTATGRNSMMIVGLGCSTQPFIEMRLPGRVSSVDERYTLRIVEKDEETGTEEQWFLDEREYVSDYRTPEDVAQMAESARDTTDEEKADQSELNQFQRAQRDAFIAKGRAAVDVWRAEQEARQQKYKIKRRKRSKS
jgi:DNA N-6-adenine-methyltransferase Dam